MPDEAASANTEDLVKTSHEGEYIKQETYSAEGIALHWKMMPLRIFIAREEKSMPGFTASEDGQDSFVRGQMQLMTFSWASTHWPLWKILAPKKAEKSTLPVLY